MTHHTTPRCIADLAVQQVRENIDHFPRDRNFAVKLVTLTQDHGVEATVICRINRQGEVIVVRGPEG